MLLAYSFLAQVGEQASQIVEDGAAAQQLISEAMDQLWLDTISPTSPLFMAINNLGLFFALGTLVLFLVQLTRQLLDDEVLRPLSDMIYPLLVVVLLANNGTLLANSVLGLRSVVNQVNTEILTDTAQVISLQEAYALVHGDIAAEGMAKALISQCSQEVDIDKRRGCIERAVESAEAAAEAQPTQKTLFDRAVSFLTGSDFTTPEFFHTNIFQIMARGLLISFGIAFQWLLEISLLLTGLLAPLAVGGTLLPMGTRSIIIWLVGFFTVAMAKLSFNIINGLVALLVLNAGENDPMIFAFATGLLSPILALILAAGGGMTVFGGLTSAARTITFMGR